MEDLQIVESLQAADHLDQYPPDLILLEVRLVLLVVHYLLVEIAIVRVVHDDAQVLFLLDEGLFVSHDVRVGNGGKDSDLVESILTLLY